MKHAWEILLVGLIATVGLWLWHATSSVFLTIGIAATRLEQENRVLEARNQIVDGVTRSHGIEAEEAVGKFESTIFSKAADISPQLRSSVATERYLHEMPVQNAADDSSAVRHLIVSAQVKRVRVEQFNEQLMRVVANVDLRFSSEKPNGEIRQDLEGHMPLEHCRLYIFKREEGGWKVDDLIDVSPYLENERSWYQYESEFLTRYGESIEQIRAQC